MRDSAHERFDALRDALALLASSACGLGHGQLRSFSHLAIEGASTF
jgi:hypothetical protein